MWSENWLFCKTNKLLWSIGFESVEPSAMSLGLVLVSCAAIEVISLGADCYMEQLEKQTISTETHTE